MDLQSLTEKRDKFIGSGVLPWYELPTEAPVAPTKAAK